MSNVMNPILIGIVHAEKKWCTHAVSDNSVTSFFVPLIYEQYEHTKYENLHIILQIPSPT